MTSAKAKGYVTRLIKAADAAAFAGAAHPDDRAGLQEDLERKQQRLLNYIGELERIANAPAGEDVGY